MNLNAVDPNTKYTDGNNAEAFRKALSLVGQIRARFGTETRFDAEHALGISVYACETDKDYTFNVRVNLQSQGVLPVCVSATTLRSTPVRTNSPSCSMSSKRRSVA